MPDLGQHFGSGLYECEASYLVKYEWAELAEDILWRRTKKGLRIPGGTDTGLENWLQKQQTGLNSTVDA